MTPADWTTASLSLLALAVAISAAVWARASALETRRQADAAEAELAILRAERDEALRARAVAPRWSIAHHSGELFVLTNLGDDAALDVVATPPPHSVTRGDFSWESVGPREEVSLFVARTLSTPSPARVSVSWSQVSGGPTQTTDLLLPPKPQR